MTFTLMPKTLATLVMSRMARRECPPSSKKFDAGPMSGTWRTSRQTSIIAVSISLAALAGDALMAGEESPHVVLTSAILYRAGGIKLDNFAFGLETADWKAVIRNSRRPSTVCLL